MPSPRGTTAPTWAALPLEPLLATVRERAARYFPGLAGTAEVRVAGERRRPYSRICRVLLRDGVGPPRALVIKVCEEADAQFRAMTAVWEHFAAHPTWKIARPLDCLAEGRALVMEAVRGVPLASRLPRVAWAGPWLRAAAAECRRAGQWLRFYHDLGRHADRVPLDVTAKWAGLQDTLDGLAAAGFRRERIARLVERLRPLADRLARTPLPAAPVHGEFTCDNLLVDGPRVTALDLWARATAPVHHDVASFLNSLALLRLTRFPPPAALRRLQEAFLAGYFGAEGRDEPAILFLQALGLVDVALEIAGRRPSGPARAWLERRVTTALEALGDGSRSRP